MRCSQSCKDYENIIIPALSHKKQKLSVKCIQLRWSHHCDEQGISFSIIILFACINYVTCATGDNFPDILHDMPSGAIDDQKCVRSTKCVIRNIPLLCYVC